MGSHKAKSHKKSTEKSKQAKKGNDAPDIAKKAAPEPAKDGKGSSKKRAAPDPPTAEAVPAPPPEAAYRPETSEVDKKRLAVADELRRVEQQVRVGCGRRGGADLGREKPCCPCRTLQPF